MSKIDCMNTPDRVVCPYCGHSHNDPYRDWTDTNTDDGYRCHKCDRTFDLESYLMRYCNTYRMTACPECGQNLRINENGCFDIHSRVVENRHEQCAGSQQKAKEEMA